METFSRARCRSADVSTRLRQRLKLALHASHAIAAHEHHVSPPGAVKLYDNGVGTGLDRRLQWRLTNGPLIHEDGCAGWNRGDDEGTDDDARSGWRHYLRRRFDIWC